MYCVLWFLSIKNLSFIMRTVVGVPQIHVYYYVTQNLTKGLTLLTHNRYFNHENYLALPTFLKFVKNFEKFNFLDQSKSSIRHVHAWVVGPLQTLNFNQHELQGIREALKITPKSCKKAKIQNKPKQNVA